jgi:hypothetical protein
MLLMKLTPNPLQHAAGASAPEMRQTADYTSPLLHHVLAARGRLYFEQLEQCLRENRIHRNALPPPPPTRPLNLPSWELDEHSLTRDPDIE